VVNEGGVDVVAWYWDSLIANTVANVFSNRGGVMKDEGARLLITGRPGTGKTTYAYYGLKVGYIKYLLTARCFSNGDSTSCIDNQVKKLYREELSRLSGKPLDEWGRELLYRRVLTEVLPDALEALEKRYGELCFGAGCSKPDGIDEKLRFMVLVSESDVDALEELIQSILLGEAKPPKALFLDDMVYKSNFWDPEYRVLYRELKELLLHHRITIPLLIATAVDRKEVIGVYVRASRNIDTVKSTVAFTDPETGEERSMMFINYRWFREVTLSRRGYDYEKNTDVSAVFTGYTIMGRDYIPKLAKFRMPRWFEEAHIDRRRRHLLRVFMKAGKMRKKAKEEEEEKAKH
jgi:hypothetical protein